MTGGNAAKVTVQVMVEFRPDGFMIPREIVWIDDSWETVHCPIDRVREVCQAAAQKVGGQGDRYTIVVNGREKSKLGEALTFLHNNGKGLSEYLNDGRLEINNNLAERSIRPFVIDRKSFLFANTPYWLSSRAPYGARGLNKTPGRPLMTSRRIRSFGSIVSVVVGVYP